MRNVLVTGGAGFIGSNFIHYLLKTEKELRVVNLDALTYAGNEASLASLRATERYTFVRGDIGDSELVRRLLREARVDTVVHFAAESHVDRSITAPGAFIETNIVGTFRLLEAARQVWLSEKLLPADQLRFHHISTDEVFGSLAPASPAFSEITPYAPGSPYAASKASSDHLVRAYHHTYGLPVTLTNCSNNYGPFQFPEKLVPLIILNALEGRPLPIYGDGQQIRDWLYVEDLCEAIHLVIRRGQVGQSYNVGGNNQSTNLEIVRTICAILDQLRPASPHRPHERLITYVADRPGHDRRYAMDITKISRELGWQPRHSLEAGLRRTIEWYLGSSEWVADIRNRPEYQGWLSRNYELRGGLQ